MITCINLKFMLTVRTVELIQIKVGRYFMSQ